MFCAVIKKKKRKRKRGKKKKKGEKINIFYNSFTQFIYDIDGTDQKNSIVGVCLDFCKAEWKGQEAGETLR